MQQIAVIGLVIISLYFFLAAFIPRLRVHWGKGVSISIYPRRPREYYRKPLMGGLSCFGIGLFTAGFPALFFLRSESSIPAVVVKIVFPLMLLGFVLVFVGSFRDKAVDECGGWKCYRPHNARAKRKN